MSSPGPRPSVPPSPLELEGTVLAGRYRITDTLAQGGMGAVLLGVDETTGQEVAVKVLRGDLAHSEEALARFRREVRAVASLDSPYIVAAHDAGTVDGMPYLVMERLRGRDLGAMAEAGELSPRRALALVIDLLEGLSHAHAAGVIHRDLKPSNVWVTEDGGVKILDFGVAKMQGEPRMAHGDTATLTGTGAVLGSPAYMSPEQLVSSKEAGVPADLWSVGVVLFELLTGRLLFRAETVGGVFANVIRMPIPLLGEVRPGASSDLERILARCLERDPERRIGSAERLAEELRAVLANDAPLIREVEGGVEPAVPMPGSAQGEDTLSEAPTLMLGEGPDRTSASAPRWLGLAVLVAAVGLLGGALYAGLRPEPVLGVEADVAGPRPEPASAASGESVPAEDEAPPAAETTASAAPTASGEPPEDAPPPAVPAAVPPPRANPPAPVPPPSPPDDDLWETSRQ